MLSYDIMTILEVLKHGLSLLQMRMFKGWLLMQSGPLWDLLTIAQMDSIQAELAMEARQKLPPCGLEAGTEEEMLHHG